MFYSVVQSLPLVTCLGLFLKPQSSAERGL